jgi:HSP20 family protein
MRIIRYQNSPVFNPSSTFSLRDEMDRLFEAALPALDSFQRDGFPGEFPVDLFQDKDAFVVRAELPGFRKEDLGVEVADGVLTLTRPRKTESKAENQDRQAGGPSQERRIGRSISLPERVKAEAIKANYENGVLTVTLPREEEVKPRQVTIDVK